MLIDTHCHLHDRDFFTDTQAQEMLKKARQNGIGRIVCIGTDPTDSLAARDFSDSHPGVYWTYGVHPEEYQKYHNEKPDFKPGSRLLAIGEVGLDYHTEGYNRAEQIKLLEKMLQMALNYNLPVSFHVREAFDDFFAVVNNFSGIRGVVHSFTDSKKNLRKVLENTDFYVGVNGLATYSTLPLPPLERILLETDAPFLTPKPFRGIINQSAYIRNIAEWLADKLGIDFKTIEKETTTNAERLFDFSDSVLQPSEG